MVQEFYTLKCFSCNMFQVHIVKKSNKWSCKICNARQSILKVFGQGTAKDCRLHVQKLNAIVQSGSLSSHLLTIEDRSTDNIHEQIENNLDDEDSNVQIPSSGFQIFPSEDENVQPSKRSKWDKFSEPFENSINEFGNQHFEDNPETLHFRRRSEKCQKLKESDKVQSDLQDDSNRLKLDSLNGLANPGQHKPENDFSNALTFPQRNEKLVEMERLEEVTENEDISRLRLKNASSNSSPREPESDSDTLNFLRRNEKLATEMERSDVTNCFQEDNTSRLSLESVCSKFPSPCHYESEAITSVVESRITDNNLTKKFVIFENVQSKKNVIQFLSENDQQEIDSILDL